MIGMGSGYRGTQSQVGLALSIPVPIKGERGNVTRLVSRL